MMQMTPACQALQMHLSRITTVDHNGLTRSLWAKQQQSGRRLTSVCHNLLTFATDGGFYVAMGSGGGPAILELWQKAFPYRLPGFNSPARLPGKLRISLSGEA